MKLISMTDFVLLQSNNENLEKHLGNENGHEFMNVWNVIFSYAQFLKQKLELWMFVPCKLVDGVWVVLDDPNILEFKIEWIKYPFKFSEESKKEYQEAKDRVLFDGFEIARSVKSVIMVSNGIPVHFCNETKEIKEENKNFTIEDLLKRNESYNNEITLTPTAQKQIGL